MTERIRDIPSLKNPLDGIRTLEGLRAALPKLAPLLRLLRISPGTLEKSLQGLEELRSQAEELATLPDTFNEVFGDRGWVLYESCSIDVAMKALEQVRQGDVDAGESTLIASFTRGSVDFHLRTMLSIRAFRDRFDLAMLALEDYEAGRYHASVPVVLALLDGMVNSVGAHGFFAKDADLSAWDSLAGHSTGLAQLARIMSQTRKTTRTEKITIPYRHGILHGMDLNYSSRMVAAKTWAALFAAGDWARKVEDGLRTEPELESASLADTIAAYRKTTEYSQQIEAWTPRDVPIGEGNPGKGDVAGYSEGTPERAAVSFLGAWMTKNYGQMANHLLVPGKSKGALAGELRAIYQVIELESYELLSIDQRPAMAVIETELAKRIGDKLVREIRKLCLVYKSDDDEPLVEGTPGGNWYVSNYRAL